MTSPLRWRPLLEAAASSCLALALAFGCEGRGGPTDRDTSSPSAPSSPLPAARGEPQVEALWGASCAGCHGPWEGRAFTQLRRRVEADPQRIHDVLASGPEGAPWHLFWYLGPGWQTRLAGAIAGAAPGWAPTIDDEGDLCPTALRTRTQTLAAQQELASEGAEPFEEACSSCHDLASQRPDRARGDWSDPGHEWLRGSSAPELYVTLAQGMTSGLRAWLAYQPCAGCHGPQGRGVGELGPALLEGGSTREALRALLVRQDHPSMGRAMSEPVRRELLAYLAELRGQDLPSERDYREALWALDEQVEPTP